MTVLPVRYGMQDRSLTVCPAAKVASLQACCLSLVAGGRVSHEFQKGHYYILSLRYFGLMLNLGSCQAHSLPLLFQVRCGCEDRLSLGLVP